MDAAPRSSPSVASGDPLREAVPPSDDVEARRARASIESRLFSGPPQPVRVGRYVVESRIGSGGMGVVYRAHDPELARDVAVKLMNADAAGTNDPSTARARLVREARAMARLAHPNVIHVYDVGTVQDGVFIAMELVEGTNLGSWFAARTPHWREILRKYIDAGRGLAAAHAAGIIHRDFKPENVLVGEDGRVRVGDFGLAGGPAALDAGSEESQLDRDTGDVHGPAGSLTQTGALLGTPKYMAPEQESGAMANARSDQFSFCVALYEALYGAPPFSGDSVAEYRHSVRHGRVLEPPAPSRVRAWVHTEIVRGLAVDPVDRHPGLQPLLDRLEEALIDPSAARRRRRRIRGLVTGATVVALLGTTAVGVWAMTRPDRPAPIPAAFERDGASLAHADVTTPAAPGRTVAAATEPSPTLPTADIDDPSSTRTPEAMAAGGADEAIDTSPTAAGPGPDTAAAPGQPGPDTAAAPSQPGPDTAAAPGQPGPDTAAAPAPTKARRKRNTGTCYFQQDKFNHLQRSRRYTRFVTGKDGRCYDCNDAAPDYRRAQLSPADCARYYLCVATTEDKCSS